MLNTVANPVKAALSFTTMYVTIAQHHNVSHNLRLPNFFLVNNIPCHPVLYDVDYTTA